MTQRLRLGIFSANVVANWAQEHGVFAAHGLAVEQLPVASSPAQFASLMNDEYDAVLTSPDNVATYVLNEGNPLGRRLDLQILRAVDRGGRCRWSGRRTSNASRTLPAGGSASTSPPPVSHSSASRCCTAPAWWPGATTRW